MVKLLSKIFIKNNKDYSDTEVRSKYGLLCSIIAIVLNILLAVAKFTVGILSGSISITADAVNNLTDAGSSIITFIGFKFSVKKPDPDHPFGHGRIEYISGMIVSGIILIAGFNTLKDSCSSAFNQIMHWFKPEVYDISKAPEFSWIVVIVLCVSIAVKFYMAFFMNDIGKKINSEVMKATGADAAGDTISTSVALVCTLINHFFNLNFDAFAGIFVSIIIMKTGYDTAKETLIKLIGAKPDQEIVKQIKETVLSYPEFIGVHDMIVHDYGPGRFMVSLHAEVDGNDDIYKLHDATDRVALEISHKFNCEAVVHMDPIDTKDETTMKYRNIVEEIISEINCGFDAHDVRVVPGHTHTNLIFDVIVPFDCKMTDDEVRTILSNRVKEYNKDCNCAITIDRPYA